MNMTSEERVERALEAMEFVSTFLEWYALEWSASLNGYRVLPLRNMFRLNRQAIHRKHKNHDWTCIGIATDEETAWLKIGVHGRLSQMN